jgi:AcrR family transcriptional regulator
VGKVSATSVKRLPRAVREQQMLDAAVKVFSRRGYHDASMDEIAEVAGISKPMVYAYLGTKDAVFIACLHREATRLLEAVADSVHAGATPVEQLWHGLRAFFGFVDAYRDGWLVLYRQARGQEPFAAELAAMRRRIVEMVAALLEGVFDGTEQVADITPMAYALVGAAESLADWLADHPDTAPEATATSMMNFVWMGADNLLRGRTWTGAPDDPASSDPDGGRPPRGERDEHERGTGDDGDLDGGTR